LLHGAFEDHDKGAWCLVLERIDGLPIQELFHSFPKALKKRKCCHIILAGIGQALQHLHNLQPCIVHGDLKPANIMVQGWSSNPRAKLIDFGLSHVRGLTSFKMGGTVAWKAPELYSQKPPAAPCPSMDMFSFSRILYFVATGTLPFGMHDLDAVQYLYASGCKPALVWGPMDEYGAHCHTLSVMMSQTDAKQRLNSDELLLHLLTMTSHNSRKCTLARSLSHVTHHVPRGEIEVWCSMETADFVVLSFTPGFASLVQTDPVNCKLINWVADSEAFLLWSTISTGLAYSRKTCIPELVTLRPPDLELSLVLDMIPSSFVNDTPPSYALFRVLEYWVLHPTDHLVQ